MCGGGGDSLHLQLQYPPWLQSVSGVHGDNGHCIAGMVEEVDVSPPPTPPLHLLLLIQTCTSFCVSLDNVHVVLLS